MAKHNREKDKKQVQLEISRTQKKNLQTNKSVSGNSCTRNFGGGGGGGITGTKLMSGRDTVLEKKKCVNCQIFYLFNFPKLLVPNPRSSCYAAYIHVGDRISRWPQRPSILATGCNPRACKQTAWPTLRHFFFFFARWDFLTSAVRRSA